MDSVYVQVTEAPITFMVSGGGVVCGTGQMKPVNLSGSQTGIKYQLFHDNNLLSEILEAVSRYNLGILISPELIPLLLFR